MCDNFSNPEFATASSASGSSRMRKPTWETYAWPYPSTFSPFEIATALFSEMLLSFLLLLSENVILFEAPGQSQRFQARRKKRSGSWKVGLLAAMAATRCMSSSVPSLELVTFWKISVV
jgi:hypothetical protein